MTRGFLARYGFVGLIVGGLVSSTVLAGCVFRGVQTREQPSAAPATVRNPFKAHLRDGSVVVFPAGGTIGATQVTGLGTRYDLAREGGVQQDTVPLDSVLGIEVYEGKTHVVGTLLGTTFAIGVTAVASAAIAVAIFGSCPTFYVWSDSVRDWTVQAEAFSTSVGPAFEMRDVDRVAVRPDADGIVRIEGRNEALETHYLNQLALLEVRHGADELVVPDPVGGPIAAAGLVAPVRARDRAGRDVRRTLRAVDGDVYATAPTVLRAASETDFRDTLELAFAVPTGADSVALLFRMRNSLLTTVLLYDVIMGDQGPRALDWFLQPRLGLGNPMAGAYIALVWPRVLVRRDTAWVQVGMLNDAGPLAWRDVGLLIPVLEPDSVVVRLAFPADVTRIDRIALGTRARRPAATTLPVHRVLDRDGRERTDALASLAAADTAYAIAQPGDVYRLEFAPEAYGGDRTFFLAARGYYIEWARPSWFSATTHPYAPTPERLVSAMRRWQAAGTDFEDRFYAQRVPVH